MADNIKVEKLKPEEFDVFIDLLDLVFGKAQGGIDFLSLLPGIYHPTQECADNHWIIRSAGRIIASIGSIPSDIMIGGQKIKAAGISGVCTHSRENGKGYMRAVMEEILSHYKQEGVMLSYLGGARKRYQRYGYEKAGIAHEFSINAKNIAECSENAKRLSVSCVPMAKDDTAAISYAKQLHDAHMIHFVDDGPRFYTKMTHWYNKPYIIRDADGAFAGYLVCSKDHDRILEIFAETEDVFEAAIIAWVTEHGSISLTLPPWKPSYIERMLRICEYVNLTNSGNWLILDWAAVIGALFQVKASYAILPDGCANIGIDGYGTLTISVNKNVTECIRTEHEPDITCDSFTATRLMCGHISPSYVMELPPALAALFPSWFPLPLYCSSPDDV